MTTAVGIHHLITGTALLNYRPEHMGQYWERIQGYPNRRWPVKKAANIIVFTRKLSRRDMNTYSPKVEWKTSWEETITRLRELHPDGAKVHVYPRGKL